MFQASRGQKNFGIASGETSDENFFFITAHRGLCPIPPPPPPLVSLSKLVKSWPGGSHVKSLKGKIFQEKNPGKSYPDFTGSHQDTI